MVITSPPDGADLIVVVDPAGAVHLAQAFERPRNLMLGVDHVAAARNASASLILRPELTAAVLDSRPLRHGRVEPSIAAAASPIAICTTSDLATRRYDPPASARKVASSS